jgi:hypothetical protein
MTPILAYTKVRRRHRLLCRIWSRVHDQVPVIRFASLPGSDTTNDRQRDSKGLFKIDLGSRQQI